ncbi:uncharacterized protein LOC135811861 [Sycon ciliatum]|uniref:uncharacterized protein LOC135811861 n=1 Tax=Sycon ciliatum TaxID=27933 RepID=UPI0031F67D8E
MIAPARVIPMAVRGHICRHVQKSRRLLSSLRRGVVDPGQQRLTRVSVSCMAAADGAHDSCKGSRLSSPAAAAPSHVDMMWDDGHSCSVDALWLRDQCMCADCRHPDSLHRNVDTFSLTDDQQHAINAELSGQDQVCVTWLDGHTSRFATDWLRVHCRQDSQIGGRPLTALEHAAPREPWTATQLERDLTRVSHDEFETAAGLSRTLNGLWRHGVALLNDVPCNEGATRAVTSRLGGIARTVYEDLWRTAPNDADGSDDRAYSRAYLGLHTDGAFVTQPPAVQVFHSYIAGQPVRDEHAHAAKNKENGSAGESILADGLQAATLLRERHPDTFDYLCRTPLAYQFCTPDVHGGAGGGLLHAVAEHPVLRYDALGNFRQVCYNTHHRAPQLCSQAHELYRHLRVFHSLLYSDQSVFSVRLQPGSVILVDNLRVLHGRTAFSGDRVLAGCYLSSDQYLCALREHVTPGGVLELS